AAASRLVIGPWAHATTVSLPGGDKPRNYRLESLAPSLAWFDRHLRGAPTTQPDPPVRIFVMGRNAWRDEDAWPLARAVPRRLHLRAGGALSWEPRAAGEARARGRRRALGGAPRGRRGARLLRLRPPRPGADDGRPDVPPRSLGGEVR